MMKARPILFSKDMATAIVNGTKTQTRRVIKRQIDCVGEFQAGYGVFTPEDHISIRGHDSKNQFGEWFLKCPYGKVRDILYGRETIWTNQNDGSVIYDKPEPKYAKFWKATPSIHVPRKHARIWLQITDIRVERLLDISDEDAVAEGIWQDDTGDFFDYSRNGFPWRFPPTDSYFSLWDSINGKDSHKINPWVWVVEFENIGFEKAMMLLNHG